MIRIRSNDSAWRIRSSWTCEPTSRRHFFKNNEQMLSDETVTPAAGHHFNQKNPPMLHR